MSQLLTGKVISHEKLVEGFYRVRIAAESLARQAKPGQFALIRCSSTFDPLLRRPFSFHDIDAEAGTVSFLYQIRGKGTQLLSQIKEGEQLDIMGPLGKGFYLPEKPAKTVLVGGGIGVAPLLFLARTLKERGYSLTVLLGAATGEQVLCRQEFEALGAEVQVATDDGSQGHRGYVTDLLEKVLERIAVSLVYACGPWPMLKKVAVACRGKDVPCQVSLDRAMACGVGACLSCVCRTRRNGKNYARICREGPVFDSEEVLWDDE
ncbi:dihydroorotate dehydrogenase electron transfer subunit [Calderihabitans maritimus]|uniref:dihydroorotate dehydrogenase electron transfer subunit n=1 Tax=Calderihabitans maritimus TaxID=1246530 RepID=UPI001863DE81|nr:dihydroorotate dehydrogenase electron transfer subunit [Calderihabitans maritimus]